MPITMMLRMFAGADIAKAMDLARRQSPTTHGAPQAVAACAYLALLLCEAIGGYGKDILRPAPVRVIQPSRPSPPESARQAARGHPFDRLFVDTLEAAMWCVDRTQGFEDALIVAVNLAGDADTVGAVTGQLAEAPYGASGIPQRWLAPLAWRERIEAKALNLYGA